ncbi:ubiquitin carboxyl-terminal hydrolase 17-like [Andrographis paniculata]|uniref:ubiquitin carboxyl-terminal hydrolase 17-like n=1 Tax=Andrographis paniculata TaxID=175694 RepID=UPI0021E79BDE|nr:ubiquitin carboxyl-terminal hydrolase 17-like [Andrographis paniculata]XP_051118054.1 ubiquitin carboxyl-terminal hydrolase 17-like [Andrographis paniculata]
MILVGDLGFLCSVVVVLVGWFVARWKWRRVAARREEIRRLMMLASEETARAELEATVGYGGYGAVQAPVVLSAAEEPVVPPVLGTGSPPARPVSCGPYRCEVCFSPTTTRCKQCKAVRYCSRKCQLIHWRDGHKDECLSLVSHQNIDGVSHPLIKEFKQEVQSSQNVFENGVMNATKRGGSHSEEDLFSDTISHVLYEKNGTETQSSNGWEKTDIDVKESFQSLPVDSSLSASSADVLIALDRNSKVCDRDGGKSSNVHVESMKPLQPNLINPKQGVAVSSDSNPLKSGCIDIDDMSDSSTSSASDDHLFATPSATPSSDFWGGAVKSIRPKVDAFDVSANFGTLNLQAANLQSSRRLKVNVETVASETDRVTRDNSCPSTSYLDKSRELSQLKEKDSSSLQFPDRVNVRADVLASDTNTVSRDDPYTSTSVASKSTQSSKLSEDVLKSRGPVLSSLKLPGQDSVGNSVMGCKSKEEAKMSSSSASLRHSANLQSSTPPDDLVQGVSRTNGNLDAVKENGSSAPGVSKTSLTSNNYAGNTIPDAQNEFAPMDAPFASCSNCYTQGAKIGTNALTRKAVGQNRASSFSRNGSLGGEVGTKGQPEGGSFSYELFVKLYNWNKIELIPRGLINCGNSCFANAVLQCLAFTPPLTAYFLQGLHTKDCKTKEWCFTCELEALVKKAKEGKTLLSPERVMSQMQNIGRNLANGREEDAHEFLRYAIETMQSACLKESGVKMPSSLNEETTLLGLTFGGYLQSKIECLGCGGRSKQHERIMDLTVEIGGDIGSLEDALRQFTRSEILDGENKYNCSRCCSYQKAKKKLRVFEAPNVLTIALKRFQSGKYGKLNKAVKFPEILNLAKYMSETSDKSPIYQLYGVVVHLDVMNATFSGHYVCYVKNNQGKWYKADDSTVQTAELEKVVSQDAYMLFYSRCSPRAPRPIRSSMIRDKKPRDHPPCKPGSCPDGPWNVGGSGCRTCACRSRSSRNPGRAKSEADSDVSSLFSEIGSYSTDSSNGESTSTTDHFDQMLLGDATTAGNNRCWNTRSRSVSDSDATSSSSSSSASSPSSTWSSLHPRHSPLANMDRYSSDTNVSCSVTDKGGFWGGAAAGMAGAAAGSGGGECKNNEKLSCKNRVGSHSSISRGVYT